MELNIFMLFMFWCVQINHLFFACHRGWTTKWIIILSISFKFQFPAYAWKAIVIRFSLWLTESSWRKSSCSPKVVLYNVKAWKIDYCKFNSEICRCVLGHLCVNPSPSLKEFILKSTDSGSSGSSGVLIWFFTKY